MTIPEQITLLIQESGNQFHAKVARRLIDEGWHVVVSPYYMDQNQNKAREIDLIAEKLIEVRDLHGRRPIGQLAVRLFIECKFIPSYSVFWFADKDKKSAEALVSSIRFFDLRNTETQKHHYLSASKKVAKLFKTSKKKASENAQSPISEKILENEQIYKALNQSLNAMIAMRNKPVSNPELGDSELPLKGTLDFPIVICDSLDLFYSVDFDVASQPKQITNNFQFEIRYAYFDHQNNQRDDYFLVDFVDFRKLDVFLNTIQTDTDIAVIAASYG